VLQVFRTGFALGIVLLFGLARLILPLRMIEQAGWALVLRAFRVRVKVQGTPARGGVLMLANHVSWIDIAALGRIVSACFVAKAEVGGWPVIGAAARRIGCLFVKRGSRKGAQGVAADIAARIGQRKDVIIFPEGTTGPGDGVLRFQSALTGIAGTGQIAVQPVALVYPGRHDRDAAAWLGDATLLPHALKLARTGGITLEIWFEPPFLAADRKQAAQQSEAVIAARLLARIGSQAETLKRAA
jgi:1-acyl-sn-glycerol-3-phosphate acyltransferase